MWKEIIACTLLNSFIVASITGYTIFGIVYDIPIIKEYLKIIPLTLVIIQTTFFFKRNDVDMNYCIWIITGMLCCLLGDVYISSTSDYSFYIAMFFFAMGYLIFGLCRPVIFRKQPSLTHIIFFLIKIILVYVIDLAILLVIDNKFVNEPDDMKIFMGIVIYSTIIVISLTMSGLFFVSRPCVSSIVNVAGITIFAISDALLIIHDIFLPNSLLEISYIILYWTSMVFISLSCIKSDKALHQGRSGYHLIRNSND